MKRIFLLIGILIFTSTLFAQEKETVFGYSGLKLTGIWGGPAYGFSEIGEESTFIRGGFFGLEFNKSFYAAYSAHWLNDRIEMDQLSGQKLDFTYKGLTLGYALNSSKIVHPKVAVLFGGGSVEVTDQEKDKVFVMQPSAGLEINVFKWWHVDVLGGYRLVSGTNNVNLDDSIMSAPFGEVRLRFGFSWGWR